MKLYEIDREIESCFLVDEETGEVVGIDEKKLDSLQTARDEKIESVLLFHKDEVAMAKQIKAEIDALKKRYEKHIKKADSLKEYAQYALGGQKFETARCSVSYRTSWAVEIEDGAEFDDEYCTVKTTRTPSKTAIGNALKNGVEIAGAKRVQRTTMSVG